MYIQKQKKESLADTLPLFPFKLRAKSLNLLLLNAIYHTKSA